MKINKKIIFLIIISITLVIFCAKYITKFNNYKIVDQVKSDNTKSETRNDIVDVDDDYDKTYDKTYDYILKNGCTLDMSNNLHTTCVEKVLKIIKLEKDFHFKNLQDLFDSRPDNVYISDKENYDNFHQWYKNSNEYNHSKCLADTYYALAGSGHDDNVMTCEIHEIQGDIQLIDDNYKFFKEYVDTMDIGIKQ